MLAIFTVGAFFSYMSATTVLQQIAALLIWIGSSTFWGLFIIGGLLARRHTHLVYSDLAMSLEKNIARPEKMQQAAGSVAAGVGADTAVQTGSDTHIMTVDEFERFPQQPPREAILAQKNFTQFEARDK